MFRFGSSIVALVALVLLGPGGAAAAQELAVAEVSQAPRFLLVSASRLVPLDVDRTPLLARRLELNLKGVALKQALAEIAQRAGLRLTFIDDDMPLERRVHLRAETITVAAALTDVLLGTGVDVVFGSDGGASLVKRSGAAVAQPGRVTGRVTSRENGGPLGGAEVLLEGTKWRTMTGEDGRYLLADVEPGSYAVTARRIGYARRSERVTVGDGQVVEADFALQAVAASLSEIVVTAQKREERLIDVPQSVSVLPAEGFARTGATQFLDFANAVPGLSFQTAGGGGWTQITLRGVTTGFDIGPTVGVYLDEVPYGSSTAFALGAQHALDVGLFDLDRVEVLRGPQGTLYGASTMGGLIKYVTKRPDATRLGVDAQAGTAGLRDGGVSYNGALAINAPIAPDRAALRASGFYSRDGGYVANLALGEEDVNRSDIYGGRVDLLFTPSEALSIRLGGFLQNIARDGQATVEYTLEGVPQYGGLDQFRRFDEPNDQRYRLGSGTLAYQFGGAALTSISSYQTARSDGPWDISAVYVPLLQAVLGRSYSGVRYSNNVRTNKFTQEVRLAGENGRPLEWVVGGFFTHETSRWEEQFDPRDPAGNPAPNDLYTFSAPSVYDEYAGFGNLTWHLTDRFSLAGGLRYAYNDQEYTQNGAGLFIGSRPTARSEQDVVTYLANARYRFSDRATGYVRYATGYRPGGPNASANDPVTGLPLGSPMFEADRLRSYEIGLKGETPNQGLGLEVAGYYIDWDNIQVQVIRGGFALRANAPGGASVRGGELTLTARPASAFTVASTLAYQDAHISEADADLGAIKGERLPNVPRFTTSLTADYELPVGKVRPTVGGTFRYVSDRRVSFDASSLPQYRLPDYATVDLRAGLTLHPVNVNLFVRNLLDERGQLSVILPQFGNRIAILQPRTIGVTVRRPF